MATAEYIWGADLAHQQVGTSVPGVAGVSINPSSDDRAGKSALVGHRGRVAAQGVRRKRSRPATTCTNTSCFRAAGRQDLKIDDANPPSRQHRHSRHSTTPRHPQLKFMPSSCELTCRNNLERVEPFTDVKLSFATRHCPRAQNRVDVSVAFLLIPRWFGKLACMACRSKGER